VTVEDVKKLVTEQLKELVSKNIIQPTSHEVGDIRMEGDVMHVELKFQPVMPIETMWPHPMIDEKQYECKHGALSKLIHDFYVDESVGGSLHIVLDDGNTADSHIRWCLENSIMKANDKTARIIAEELLKLDDQTRKNMYENGWVYKPTGIDIMREAIDAGRDNGNAGEGGPE
jgi:hypothetical protein